MRRNWIFLGWYYYQGAERIGPVPPEEIDRLLARGRLRPSDEILKAWKDANNQIRYFGSHAEFARSAALEEWAK